MKEEWLNKFTTTLNLLHSSWNDAFSGSDHVARKDEKWLINKYLKGEQKEAVVNLRYYAHIH